MRLATCSCERRRSLAERTSTSEVFIDLVVFQILALNATFHLNSYIWNLNKPVWQLCMSTQYQRLVLQNQVIKKHHVFFGILLNNTFVPSIYIFIYIYIHKWLHIFNHANQFSNLMMLWGHVQWHDPTPRCYSGIAPPATASSQLSPERSNVSPVSPLPKGKHDNWHPDALLDSWVTINFHSYFSDGDAIFWHDNSPGHLCNCKQLHDSSTFRITTVLESLCVRQHHNKNAMRMRCYDSFCVANCIMKGSWWN